MRFLLLLIVIILAGGGDDDDPLKEGEPVANFVSADPLCGDALWALGVRVFDTYGISTANLILTLRNCGLNKRMHYREVH